MAIAPGTAIVACSGACQNPPMPGAVDMTFVTTDVGGGTWLEWGTSIDNVTDMVDKAIARLKPGECIGRLIICSHGAVGATGFAAFDSDTTGSEVIEGGMKDPLSSGVREQLGRLKKYFCPEGVIEFRVCLFGAGDHGARSLQAVADVTGVNVTGPENTIKGVMGLGGIATTWATAYPVGTGIPLQHSFWRGSGAHLKPPVGGGPGGGDIAEVPKYIPMPGLPPPPPPGPAVVPEVVLNSLGAVEVKPTVLGGSGTRLAAGAGAGLVVGLGLAFLTAPGTPTATALTSPISFTWLDPFTGASPAMNGFHVGLDGNITMTVVPPLCAGFAPTFNGGFNIKLDGNQIFTTIQGGQASPGTINADGTFLTRDAFDSVKGTLRVTTQPQPLVVVYTFNGQVCTYNANATFPNFGGVQAAPIPIAGLFPDSFALGGGGYPGPAPPLLPVGIVGGLLAIGGGVVFASYDRSSEMAAELRERGYKSTQSTIPREFQVRDPEKDKEPR